MAGGARGFDRYGAVLGKICDSSTRTTWTQIQATAEKTLSILDTAFLEDGHPIPDEEDLLSSRNIYLANHTRCVRMSNNFQVEVDAFVRMNQLFVLEGEVINLAERLTLETLLFQKPEHEFDRVGRKKKANKELARFQSLRDNIKRSAPAHILKRERAHSICRQTDELFRDTYATFLTGDATNHDDELVIEDQILLELFTRRCKSPNDAEIEMLAVYFDVGVWEIYDWCKYSQSVAGLNACVDHADIHVVEERGLGSRTNLYAMASSLSKRKGIWRSIMFLRIHACVVRANRRIVDELRAQEVRQKLEVLRAAKTTAKIGQKRKAEVPLEVIEEEVD